MSTPSTPLVLLPLLLLLLNPRPASADISPQYHNYFDTTTVCGMSPLNKRVNSSFLPVGRAAPYVINGNDVHYGEWPFVAWVKLNRTSCTGVIVSSEVVVTAGHCLRLGLKDWDSGIKTELDSKIPAYVTVGKINFRSTDEFEARHDIKAIQRGAYYRTRGFMEPHPDFGRLWLREPIEYNDYVQYICIPSDPETVYKLAVGPVFFIGNGVYLEKPVPTFPNVTQWLQMKASDPHFWITRESNKECASETWFTSYDDTFRKTCVGDSGGPLVALDQNKRWSLVGIARSTYSYCQKNYFVRPRDTFVLMAKIVGIFDKNFRPPPDGDATE